MKILLCLLFAMASLQAFGQEKEKDLTSQTISLQLQSWSMITLSAPSSSNSLEIRSSSEWIAKKTLSSTDLPYQNSKMDVSLNVTLSSPVSYTSSAPFTFYTVSPE